MKRGEIILKSIWEMSENNPLLDELFKNCSKSFTAEILRFELYIFPSNTHFFYYFFLDELYKIDVK